MANGIPQYKITKCGTYGGLNGTSKYIYSALFCRVYLQMGVRKAAAEGTPIGNRNRKKTNGV